jgi:hypothetical protein
MFTYLRQSDNLIPDATLTPTSEDADYPVENLQAEPVAETYRSASASAQKILIDFAAPVTVDLFAVANHNLTSSATLTLRGGSSQDPDGMDFEVALPWGIHYALGARRNASFVLAAAETWQYWSLTIDDAGNPDGLLEIGLLMAGAAVELTRDFNFGWEARRETLNQVLESEYGVITTGSNLYQRTRFIASWKATSGAEREELDTFLTGLEKERGGMLFIPDPSAAKSYYGRLLTDHAIIRTSPDIAELNGLEFLEDSVGKSLF